MRTRWTAVEVAVLEDYPRAGLAYVADKLPRRSEDGITSAARRLGLRRRERQHRTPPLESDQVKDVEPRTPQFRLQDA